MQWVIRPAEKHDAKGIRDLYAEPHAYAGTLQLPFPPEHLWQSRLDAPAPGLHNLLASLDTKIIGQLGLSTNSNPRRKHVAEFGMAVSQSYLGRGVGSGLLAAALDLCDNWLNIERVELQVYRDNAAAIGLYKKFGFVVEGEHPRFAFRAGAFVDVLSMARLR